MPSEVTFYSDTHKYHPIDDGDVFSVSYESLSTTDISQIRIAFTSQNGAIPAIGVIPSANKVEVDLGGKYQHYYGLSLTTGHFTWLRSGSIFTIYANGEKLGSMGTPGSIPKATTVCVSAYNRNTYNPTQLSFGPFRASVFSGTAGNAIARFCDAAALTIGNRRKDLEEREQKVKEKEDKVSTVVQRPNPNQIRPSNYDSIKDCAQNFWPFAIAKVLDYVVAKQLEVDHRQFMDKWVDERGDKLNPDAYDYLVYSHGVAWPFIISNSSKVTNDQYKTVQSEFSKIAKLMP